MLLSKGAHVREAQTLAAVTGGESASRKPEHLARKSVIQTCSGLMLAFLVFRSNSGWDMASDVSGAFDAASALVKDPIYGVISRIRSTEPYSNGVNPDIGRSMNRMLDSAKVVC